MFKPAFSNQKGFSLLFIFFGVIVVTIIILCLVWFFFLRSNNQSNNNSSPNSDVILAAHPQLFIADLEFDPNTKIMTQHRLSKTNADPPNLLSEKPASSSAQTKSVRFNYKVEVISKDGKLVQSGWNSLSTNVIKTKKNTLRFFVYARFLPDATIRIFSDNQEVLWTGKMK